MTTPDKRSYDYFVSYFQTVYSNYPTQISLLHFLHSIKSCIYEYRIQLIRNQEDKQERQKIKASLSAICCSALFDGHRNISNVTKTTGLISIDIDYCENLEKTLTIVKQDKYTFSCFISPSGKGVKAIVKADFTLSTFINSFTALEKYYKRKLNIIIDPVCKDITRLMFVSSDKDLYINHLSEIFTDQLKPYTPPIKKPSPAIHFDNSNLTERIINKIQASHIDITSTYSDWIKIAYALVNEFGITGLQYFLQISQYYPKFDTSEAEKVFRSCYRSGSNSVSIKSLYKIASWHGITYKD